MKSKIRFTSLLSLAFVGFIAVGAVSGCKMSPEKRAEKITDHVSDKLDLTDAQKAEFKKLADQATADFKALQSSRKDLANEVEKQMLSPKAETAEIKKIAAEQNTKRQELTNLWIDRIAEFHSKLSPQQKEKSLKLLKNFREKFESRFED